MNKLATTLAAICFLMMTGNAQVKMRKLPPTISHPSYNNFAPFISADGNSIIFLSDNAEDNVIAPFYSTRNDNDWKQPQMLPKNIYSRVNFVRGFSLSADGKKLFLTTTKSPNVGGYDIQMSELKGSTWSEPVNLGLPVNSKLHDGCATVSSDGNTMYFMRCEKMTVDKAEGCKIFRADKKPNGVWGDPVELPASINSGNSQMPRIMADGQTLLFASDKIRGGKGGMDIYSSTLKNGVWSTPIAWDFINTEKDDQDVSVNAQGRYVDRDAKGTRNNELVEYLIPDNLRPRGMTKLDGRVVDAAGKPIAAYISITDVTNNKRYYSGRPYADGSFIVYAMEGSKYDVAVEGEQDNLIYFSKQLDLTSDKIPQVEKIVATIRPLAIGDELILPNVKFKDYTAELDTKASSIDLDRVTRIMKGNPNSRFEIQVSLQGLLQDSVQSLPDLTEVQFDSIKMRVFRRDSTGNEVAKDTVMVKRKYTNNRTARQANSIVNYFVSKGFSPANFSVVVAATPALPENKKTIVKVVARPKA